MRQASKQFFELVGNLFVMALMHTPVLRFLHGGHSWHSLSFEDAVGQERFLCTIPPLVKGQWKYKF